MNFNSKIYVAGHRGLVGSALVCRLLAAGHSPQSLVLRTHSELDGRCASILRLGETGIRHPRRGHPNPSPGGRGTKPKTSPS